VGRLGDRRCGGVGPEIVRILHPESTPEVSLGEDLAADSLDLVELALALEGEFGIAIPERILERVRSYGDLVQATVAVVREVARRAATPVLLRARVVPRDGIRGALERAGWLTPYTAETIAEDALRAGRGARLEVTVAADTSDGGLARVRAQFAWLGGRGIGVYIDRNRPPGAGWGEDGGPAPRGQGADSAA